MQSLLLADNPMFGSYGEGIYVFTLPIQYYAIVIVFGMILAATLSALLMKRRNISPDFIFTLFIVCIPSAIVGARLFSCLTDGSVGTYPFGQWFVRFIKPPWEGLSITGGVIGGVVAGFIVCRVKKMNFLRVADCVVVTILLAQAIGRWGNFFNKEVYGREVTDPSMQWFPFAVPVSPDPNVKGIASFSDPASKWHYAFFFYEMMINLVGFAILFTAAWFRKKKPNGILTCLYFVWYGTVRSVMEPLRDAKFILDAGSVPWSQLFAILMVGLGICGILALLISNHVREGSFVGSKRGDPCGITAFLSPDPDEKPYYSKINMLGANYPPVPSKEELKRIKAEIAAKREREKLRGKGTDDPRGGGHS